MTNEIAAIWNRFHKELGRFIDKKVKSRADTDDVLQEVFVKIIQHKEKVESAVDMRQYIYAIVRNEISNYFRKWKRNDGLQITEDLLNDEENQDLNATIAACCIRPFVNQLPDKYREALLLTEINAIPQKDVANSLNISYSGAKSRIQRGRAKLKELILNCCAFQSDAYGNLIDTGESNCGCA